VLSSHFSPGPWGDRTNFKGFGCRDSGGVQQLLFLGADASRSRIQDEQ
jgi:hypothetical protein